MIARLLRKKTRYMGWHSYKTKIDFLSEFYSEQADLQLKATS